MNNRAAAVQPRRIMMDRFPPPHPIYPPVIHYGPAPIPLRKEPHIPLTPKTGMRREEIERRIAEAGVTAEEKAAWNAKYAKPSTGIPKTDLASGVQASLGKADTALQEHQSLDGYATEEWVGEQGFLTQHQDITGKVDKTALFDNPDTTPKVKSSLLPSYVDDVLEFASLSVFPTTGETGKIYVALDTNKTYRWGGTQYVQVGGDEQAQADWAQTNSSSPDFIKNKPTIPVAQVQANWNETNTSSKAYIQNKPTIPTVPTNVSAFTNDAGYLTQHQSLSAYRTATAQNEIDDAQNQRIYGVENSAQQALNGLDALDRVKAYGYALAAAYDPNRGSAYAVGDYCTNAGTLFKCTTATANPPGAWNAANWTEVAVTNEITKFVPWANAAKNAVTIGKRKGNVGTGSLAVGLAESYSNGAEASGKGSLAVGSATASGMNSMAVGMAKALSLYSFAAGAATADGQNGAAFGSSSTSNSSSNEFAAGEECIANGRNSIALGYRARTGSGTGSGAGTALFTTFVWNQSSTYYHSKGAGTFCINPNGGTAGFYIGNDNLSGLLSSKADASHTHASIVSPDTKTTAVATNDGTVDVSRDGGYSGTIEDWDDLAEACGLTPSDSLTPDDIRNALGLPITATIQEAIDAAQNLSWTRSVAFQDAIAAPFSPSTAYAVGALCTRFGLLYECTTAHAAGAWNPSHFAKKTVAESFPDISGKANIADLRYRLVTVSVSGSGSSASAALEDRAVNTVNVGSSVTALSLVFPAASTGYARDFLLRLVVSGTNAPTITLPQTATVEFGNDYADSITTGTNLVLFTEVAANRWLVGVKGAES